MSSQPAADTALIDQAPALCVRDLDAGYGRTQVLRGVSLTVEQSGIVALLGSNGAGKTTLLRTISGLIPALRGSVQILGHDVQRLSTHKRFALGMCHVPEGRGIFRSLTVRQNLIMQVGSRRIDEAIERVGQVFPILTSRLDQKAGLMSGGEQQMLAMVAAYVRNPRLILVDEASLGLAPLVVDEIYQFLAGVTSTGTALLVVDQFVAKVLDLVSTAYVMNQGEIVFSGTADELAGQDIFQHYLGA